MLPDVASSAAVADARLGPPQCTQLSLLVRAVCAATAGSHPLLGSVTTGPCWHLQAGSSAAEAAGTSNHMYVTYLSAALYCLPHFSQPCTQHAVVASSEPWPGLAARLDCCTGAAAAAVWGPDVSFWMAGSLGKLPPAPPRMLPVCTQI